VVVREQDVERIRQQAQRLVQRMTDEPVFRQQVKANPAAVLASEGLPDPAIGDVMRELSLGDDDVVGYSWKDHETPCDGITCIVSVCNCSLCGTTGF
jgi:hypothetical protein